MMCGDYMMMNYACRALPFLCVDEGPHKFRKFKEKDILVVIIGLSRRNPNLFISWYVEH
jgi:hypothetical protein